MMHANERDILDESDLPTLPELGSDDSPATDLEIGDDFPPDVSEDIGLDASEGIDDDEDFLTPLDESSASDGWEAPLDASLDYDLVFDSDAGEQAWIDGSEEAEAPGWDSDLVEFDEIVSVGDAGEEGVEESFDESLRIESERGISLGDEESLADDLQIDDETELRFTDEPGAPEPERLASLTAYPVQGEQLVGLASDFVVGQRAIRRCESEPEGLGPAREVPSEPTGVVRDASGALVLALRSGGVLRSIDEGRSWVPVSAISRAIANDDVPSFVRADESGRLWVRGARGALARCEDGWISWAKVADDVDAFAVTGSTLWTAASRGGQVELGSSADGGRSWTKAAAPAVGAVLALAVLDGTIALSGANCTLWSRDAGASWNELPATRGARHPCLAREDGVVLYADALDEAGLRGRVLRAPLGGAILPDTTVVIDLRDAQSANDAMLDDEPELVGLSVRVEAGTTIVDIAVRTGWIRAKRARS